MSIPDYYSLLGVPRFYATQEEIRSAYLKQVRFFHPDAANVPPQIAQMKTQELNQAYEVLRDINKKRVYDEKLDIHLQSCSENERDKNGFTDKRRTSENIKEKKRRIFFNYDIIAFAIVVLAVIIFYSSKITELQSEIDNSIPNISPSNIAKTTKTETKDKELNPRTFYNGIVFRVPKSKRLCPLSIITTGSEKYFIYLKSIDDEKNDLAFGVVGGQTASVLVPIGSYEMFYATGYTWYGIDNFFGENTTRYKCDETFTFYDDGQYYQGYTVELYEQYDGNMSTKEIEEYEFPI